MSINTELTNKLRRQLSTFWNRCSEWKEKEWLNLPTPLLLTIHSQNRSYLRGRNFHGNLIFANFFLGHFVGINFREFGFTEDFTGINFRELSLSKDFAGTNFRESALFKDFAGVYLTFALWNIFSMTLIYGYENNLSEN